MRKMILISIILPGMLMLSCNRITIEDATWENRPHFRIETKTATYFFDKAGGGFSRVIDTDDVDWVNFNGDVTAEVPTGAAGSYRGIPNMVYRFDDGGAGHPGFDQCISEKEGENIIRTRSKRGKWQWSWTFYYDHASMTLEKTDPDRTFWFLYEGPVAGSFKPERKYWGTDLGGPRFETPSLNRGENIVGNWQWVYFGDKETDRIFYVAQNPKDTLNDFFAYMGNTKEGNSSPDGMIVFGFSRDKGTVALEQKSDVNYKIGFLERKITSREDHDWATKQIESILNGN